MYRRLVCVLFIAKSVEVESYIFYLVASKKSQLGSKISSEFATL